MLGRRRNVEEMREAPRRLAEGRMDDDIRDELAIHIDAAAILEGTQIVLAGAHLRLRHESCSDLTASLAGFSRLCATLQHTSPLEGGGRPRSGRVGVTAAQRVRRGHVTPPPGSPL